MNLTEPLFPHRVFGGSPVSVMPFSREDILENIHSLKSKKETCLVFKLKDGRFVSFYSKFYGYLVDGKTIEDTATVYVADSYDEIVRLGLTTRLRRIFQIQDRKN